MAQIVTITNPLTGQPAQVDQLEHTAQEIDDAIARALPGGAIDTALQKKVEIKLLWENASPSSSFENQTISLDLSNYNAVIVNLNHSNSIPAVQSSIFVPIGEQGCMWDSYSESQSYRIFAVAWTGVIFSQSTGSGYGIPKQIFRVKL